MNIFLCAKIMFHFKMFYSLIQSSTYYEFYVNVVHFFTQSPIYSVLVNINFWNMCIYTNFRANLFYRNSPCFIPGSLKSLGRSKRALVPTLSFVSQILNSSVWLYSCSRTSLVTYSLCLKTQHKSENRHKQLKY